METAAVVHLQRRAHVRTLAEGPQQLAEDLLRPVGVGLDEGVTNHLNVGLGVLDAHPQVGVDLTVDVGSEHRLGQLVDGGAGTSQEPERR